MTGGRGSVTGGRARVTGGRACVTGGCAGVTGGRASLTYDRVNRCGSIAIPDRVRTLNGPEAKVQKPPPVY